MLSFVLRSNQPPLTLTISIQHSNSNSVLFSLYKLISILEIQSEKQQVSNIKKELTLDMATLHKFKLLVTQCGVAQSPTRTPTTSPLVQIRRRKTTLRMLLGRSSGRRLPRRPESRLRQEHLSDSDSSEKKGKDLMRRQSLKDLFGSSPPWEEDHEMRHATESGSDANMGLGSWSINGSDRPGSPPKPGWTGFRCRSLLKRKVWRPMLITIPE